MIHGIGIDMIELERIQTSMQKSNRLAERILTINEIEKFRSLTNKRRQLEYLAGRFAAKEACAKALGTGIGKLSFQHIEVINNKEGAPKMGVDGYEGFQFFLSISHTHEHAIAQVVIQQG